MNNRTWFYLISHWDGDPDGCGGCCGQRGGLLEDCALEYEAGVRALDGGLALAHRDQGPVLVGQRGRQLDLHQGLLARPLHHRDQGLAHWQLLDLLIQTDPDRAVLLLVRVLPLVLLTRRSVGVDTEASVLLSLDSQKSLDGPHRPVALEDAVPALVPLPHLLYAV